MVYIGMFIKSFITPGILFRGNLIGTGCQAVKHSKKLGKIPKVQKHSTKLENIRKHYKNFKIILPHFVVCQHPCTQQTIFSLHHRSLVLPTFFTAAPNTSKKNTQFNKKKKDN
jgi:hypothetical protein